MNQQLKVVCEPDDATCTYMIGWVPKFGLPNHGHAKFICQNVGKNSNWLGVKYDSQNFGHQLV